MDTYTAAMFDCEIEETVLAIEGELNKVLSVELQELLYDYLCLSIYRCDLPIPEKMNIDRPTKLGTLHAERCLTNARAILESLVINA